MKYVNKYLLLLVTSLIFAININAEEEKSDLWNKNTLYCEGKEVNVEGCYKKDEKEYEDLKDLPSMIFASPPPQMVMPGQTPSPQPPSDQITIKSAKYMQSYTLLNKDEKVVLGTCYKGYVKNEKYEQNVPCSGTTTYYSNEVVSEKDSEHNIEVIILRVTEPRKNNTCVTIKTQFIFNSGMRTVNPLNENIGTPEYDGYKKGSCPQYFAYSSELKGLNLLINPELEYLFTDNSAAKIERIGLQKFVDSFLSPNFSSRVGGCTQKDVEEEDKAKKCYEDKLEKVENYKCPANIKDFNLDLENYAKECSNADLYAGYAYSSNYAAELKKEYSSKIKNAYAEKIEMCTLENCNLTSAEITSVRNKMKGKICEFGCKIAVYETESNTAEGKCIACGGSQGVTYRWASKDYTPSGNCSEVNLSHDKCLGDSKTQECSDCYNTAYSGLSDEKKTCLMNILGEKADKIQEYSETVDEQFSDFTDIIQQGLEDVLSQIWDSSFVTFTIPGMSDGGFGPKGQSCSEILKNNGVKIIKGIVNVLRIAGAIIAIANAMIVLIPAVISKDADGLKKAGRKLVVMAVVLAIVGILPSIVYLIGVVFGYDLSCIF